MGWDGCQIGSVRIAFRAGLGWDWGEFAQSSQARFEWVLRSCQARLRWALGGTPEGWGRVGVGPGQVFRLDLGRVEQAEDG